MKKIVNNVIIVIMMGLVPAMTSCQGLIDAVVGSEDKPTTTQNVVHISGITIVGEGIVNGELSLKVGDILQLATTITPAETTETEINWKSSDESVITVSSTGLLTAVKAGTVTITVTSAIDASITASIIVIVSESSTDIHITGISITSESLNDGKVSLNVGDKHQLATTFTPAETTETEVNWKSSDESVITVSSTGLLTAVKVGSATVTVTSAVNATVSSSINIVVSDGELNISDDPVDQSKAETRG
jgi:Bacterial surface proteins containing Ig-like domains